jgi:hypothetical protein
MAYVRMAYCVQSCRVAHYTQGFAGQSNEAGQNLISMFFLAYLRRHNKMQKLLKVMVLTAAVGAAFPVMAAPTLVTTDVGYTGPQLDLTGFDNGSYNFTFGPVSLPNGITFTAAPGGGGNSGNGSVIGQGGYGLAGNGSFGGTATYIGVDSGTGYAEFTFASAVSSFGGYWNYAPGYGDAPTLSTYDGFGNQLSSFDLSALAPISTPGGFNEFEFRYCPRYGRHQDIPLWRQLYPASATLAPVPGKPKFTFSAAQNAAIRLGSRRCRRAQRVPGSARRRH